MPVALPPSALARLIDHTLLKPEARAGEIERACEEALRHGFASVCVNGGHVRRVAARLAGSPVKTCSVIGFPLGAGTSEAKAAEATEAVAGGATEIDMVLNVGALKDRDDAAVARDIATVKRACGSALLKVIVETCLLDPEEKQRACGLAEAAGADFVKTSTGFGRAGATLDDVALMRQCVGDRLGVKASGGIRTLAAALAMVEAGASRLGLSASVAIMAEAGAGGKAGAAGPGSAPSDY